MSAKLAFVFPGQASQSLGMGRDFVEAYPMAREVFEQTDDLLGFAFSKICFEGSEETLNDTINTQPALYVCGVAILRVLNHERPDIQPDFVAGHSLGEFTALTASGALAFADGLRLVRERGRLMKEAGEKNSGAMAALLGLDLDSAQAVCARASERTQLAVVVANDNCPGQVVISGDVLALEAAMELAKEAGAKRAVKLAVSIAAHSPLMESAAVEFGRLVAKTTLKIPLRPVYGNVDALPLHDIDTIRSELNHQLTQTVRWTDSVKAMIAAGAERFVEIGSGDVLTGLLKRIDRNVEGVALNSVDALKKLV